MIAPISVICLPARVPACRPRACVAALPVSTHPPISPPVLLTASSAVRSQPQRPWQRLASEPQRSSGEHHLLHPPLGPCPPAAICAGACHGPAARVRAGTSEPGSFSAHSGHEGRYIRDSILLVQSLHAAGVALPLAEPRRGRRGTPRWLRVLDWRVNAVPRGLCRGVH